MQKRSFFCFLIIILILSVLIVSCASLKDRSSPAATERPMYYGRASGTTALEALNNAKVQAVRKAVSDLLGPASFAANKDKIEADLFGKININSLVMNDTLVTFQAGREGDLYFSDLGIRVDLKALAILLRKNDIYGNQITPGESKPVLLPDQTPPSGRLVQGNTQGTSKETASGAEPVTSVSKTPAPLPAQKASPSSSLPEATEEERRFIDNHIRLMTYMIYYNEDKVEDPFVMTTAVSIANEYLVSQKREIVDSRQIEEVKRDRELAYEESTGSVMSLIQWIAQKANADVYGEIEASTVGETQGRNHYGKANVAVRFFEASTGRLLSSRTYSSPRTFSISSQQDAIANALQSSLYELMPLLLADVEGYMAKALLSGIKYDLIIQGTEDARLMREFMQSLERRVKSVKRTFQSAEETRYEVYLLGTVEDLEDLVYDLADIVPGLAGLELIYMRGNSLTFHSGL